MSNADRIIELLHEARLRPAGAERDRFLDQACGRDLALTAQIVSLLEAEAGDNGSFLRTVPAYRQPILPTEKPGDTIGRYKLLQQIGEGGCGVVYMAEPQEPVRRRVALKVIKLGMDTKSVIARFEAERRAPGAGADGSSEHRESIRCGRDGHGPAVLRHGIGAWHQDHRLLRSEPSQHQ